MACSSPNDKYAIKVLLPEWCSESSAFQAQDSEFKSHPTFLFQIESHAL